MIDIHCHCLPALDDGPPTLAEAISLCEALVADGVSTAVATPHQLGRYRATNTATRVCDAVAALRRELQDRSIPLEVLPGADVRIEPDLAALVSAGEVLTVAGAGRYLLLEMPHELFIDAGRLVQALAQRNLYVVLTHPERYRWIRHHIARMLEWRKEFGALMQVTAASLAGDFGPEIENLTWQMAERGMIDVVASDAHSVNGHRRPRMSAARDLVARRLGEETATRWFDTTPRSLITPNP